MVIALLVILYILFILYPYGQGVLFLLKKLFKTEAAEDLSLVFIAGLMFVTTLASFASLFIRINWEFQIALLAGALALYILIVVRHHLYPKISLKDFNLAQKIGAGFLAIFLVVILYQATLAPANADTGIYHAQTIHWIETYPAVPGLGNFHNRLAYDSSWLMGSAAFSLSFLSGRSFHLLTAVLFLILAVYFYRGIHALLAGKFQLSNFLRMGFFLASFIFIFDQVSSPGTDAPTTLLIWYLVCRLTVLVEEKKSLNNTVEVPALFFLCFYFFTVKVSSAPILLLPLIWWILLLVKKEFRLAGKTALGALIVVLPFILRNFIQTGYPVYPGFPIDLFHFDWAIPQSSVSAESQVIHWFATLPSVSNEEFLKMSAADQTINWFANQLPRNKAILLFIPAALAINLLFCVFKGWRKEIKNNWPVIVIDAVVLAGCAFWFFSAPAMRFGYGFLLAAVLLLTFQPAAFIIGRIKWANKAVSILVLIGVVALVGLTMRSTIKLEKVSGTLVMPADYPQWSSEPCTFKNFKTLCQASYDSCWYSPFPCAIKGNPNVEMRGEDYREGFRYVK